MQFLKQEKQEELDTPDKYINKFVQNRETIQRLTAENMVLERQALDMTIRKVIDSGLVFMGCSHKNITKYDKLSKEQKSNLKKRIKDYLDHEFEYVCLSCGIGLNEHTCSVENEKYYFSCDEARVINNVARQYGINGHIETATRVRD